MLRNLHYNSHLCIWPPPTEHPAKQPSNRLTRQHYTQFALLIERAQQQLWRQLDTARTSGLVLGLTTGEAANKEKRGEEVDLKVYLAAGSR